MEVSVILILLIAQSIFLLVSFLYFRNKLRKNTRSLYERIQGNRKALKAGEELLAEKMDKSSKAVTKLQDSFEKTGGSLNKQRAKLSSVKFRPHVFAVLSLPKCGTSSVTMTLQHSFPDSKVMHWHPYAYTAMQRIADIAEKTENKVVINNMIQRLRLATDHRGILNESESENTTFLTGVRDPIALGLSLFFEQYYNPSHYPDQPDYSVEEIRQAIEESERLWFDLLRLDEWFEENLLAASGHDVFATPFPKEEGYKIYRGGRGDLCVYRLENHEVIIDAIADAVEIPAILLESKRANVANERAYSKKYKEVLEEIKFSEDFVTTIYQSRYSTHFYSPSELEEFKARWSR